MDEERLVKISKYLSEHLRHQPERRGLTLEPGGWVRIDDLLAACAARGMALTRAQLCEVVANYGKQRFSFDDSLARIRANQGHSVDVDLQLEPSDPPAVLYHGTAQSSVAPIYAQGISKMKRHHVHLSRDIETALAVGARHGKPVVLAINTAAMVRDGAKFCVSENGVWLTDNIAPQYLSVTTNAGRLAGRT